MALQIPVLAAGGESVGSALAFYSLLFVILFVPQYLLNAVGLQAISQRRGIKYPWLAWIPVASSWTLGCISDQYQREEKGKDTKRRKALLTVRILAVLFGMATLFLMLNIQLKYGEETGPTLSQEAMDAMSGFVMVLMAFVAVSLVEAVMRYFSLNDLFKSCDPEYSTLMLFVCITANIMIPTLVLAQQLMIFLCRKKDRGIHLDFLQTEA